MVLLGAATLVQQLCHAAGSELEQIHFLLGHVSIQTTGRYLGCKQRIRSAVNGRIGIEPEDRVARHHVRVAFGHNS
jgi:hypothetical protein